MRVIATLFYLGQMLVGRFGYDSGAATSFTVIIGTGDALPAYDLDVGLWAAGVREEWFLTGSAL